MTAAERIYIDPRVTRTMKDAPEEGLVGYVREDLARKASAAVRGQEIIIQLITNPEGRLVGLSSWGRVYVLLQEDAGSPPVWSLVQEGIEGQGLDS